MFSKIDGLVAVECMAIEQALCLHNLEWCITILIICIHFFFESLIIDAGFVPAIFTDVSGGVVDHTRVVLIIVLIYINCYMLLLVLDCFRLLLNLCWSLDMPCDELRMVPFVDGWPLVTSLTVESMLLVFFLPWTMLCIWCCLADVTVTLTKLQTQYACLCSPVQCVNNHLLVLR
jgi:hypothetical protein